MVATSANRIRKARTAPAAQTAATGGSASTDVMNAAKESSAMVMMKTHSAAPTSEHPPVLVTSRRVVRELPVDGRADVDAVVAGEVEHANEYVSELGRHTFRLVGLLPERVRLVHLVAATDLLDGLRHFGDDERELLHAQRSLGIRRAERLLRDQVVPETALAVARVDLFSQDVQLRQLVHDVLRSPLRRGQFRGE
ncbi:hypothetical protein ACFPRL_27330 [Pseudoclavibacter helvolus]